MTTWTKAEEELTAGADPQPEPVPRPFLLTAWPHRTPAQQLRYLACRIEEGLDSPAAHALALDVLAGELEDRARDLDALAMEYKDSS